MIIEQPKYSFCDLQIKPARTTSIVSRKECNARYGDMLPLFTAPMDSVVDDKNYQIYKNSGINVIIHRDVNFEKRLELTKLGEWCAYTLSEFERVFCNETTEIYDNVETVHALIDLANGHMEKIFTLAKAAKKLAKEKNVKLVLMSGNIANPETYRDYCEAGIDYVRCSIGTGSMCLTSANLSVGMSNASLIDEMYHIKQELITDVTTHYYENKHSEYFTYTKIVADGGIKNYSDAIVALACGADYVMVGGIFASFLESCADIVENNGPNDAHLGFLYQHNEDHFVFSIPRTTDNYKEYNELVTKYNLSDAKYTNTPLVKTSYDHMLIDFSTEQLYIPEVAKWIVKHTHLKKTSHGMSTKEAQIRGMISRGEKVDKSKLKTSEGKTIERAVQYTVGQWTENFEDYLRSAMSYTNCRTLEDFKGKCELTIKSRGTMMTVNK